jgi:sec-independent protein translocase protein TatC
MMAHLKELRNRLIFSVLGWLALSGVAFYFAAHLYQFLVAPLAEIWQGDPSRRLIYTGLTETFLVYIKLSLSAGLAAAFPLISYQLYRFIAPGLYAYERKRFWPFLTAAPMLFLIGAGFAYYVVIPLAWVFFLSFEQSAIGQSLPLVLEARISEYIALSLQLIIAFGLAFQLPVVLILLTRAGLISKRDLQRNRRYAVVILLGLAAIVTPPDVLSQLMLFTPLYLLYEVSIMFSRHAITLSEE